MFKCSNIGLTDKISSDDNFCLNTAYLVKRYAGVLETLVGDFKKLTLLRLHGDAVGTTDVEELFIKDGRIHVFDPHATRRLHSSWSS